MTSEKQDQLLDGITKYLRERLRTVGKMRAALDDEERAIMTMLRHLESDQ